MLCFLATDCGLAAVVKTPTLFALTLEHASTITRKKLLLLFSV